MKGTEIKQHLTSKTGVKEKLTKLAHCDPQAFNEMLDETLVVHLKEVRNNTDVRSRLATEVYHIWPTHSTILDIKPAVSSTV